MDIPQIYVLISIIILAVIALFIFLLRKNRSDKKLTPLASLAFGFILIGIIFSDDRFIGYGLIGVGVGLAVIDIISKIKSKQIIN